MKPLNAFRYLKKNFKTVLPIFLSVAVGVFFIYIFALFSATTNKMVSVASTLLMEKYNVAYTNDSDSLERSFLEKIKSSGVEVLPVQMNLSGLPYYRGGMGGTTMLTFNLFEEDVGALLDSYELKLVEGKLPQNNRSEILVPQEYAKQNKLSVGDYIGTKVSDEYALQGKYLVCGLTRGEVVFAVSCEPKSKTKTEVLSSGVMYRVDDLNAVQQVNLAESLEENAVFLTHNYYEREYKATRSSMQTLNFILTAVMIIILCIALGNLNVILFAGRGDELTILHSIGFTSGKLARKLWLENLLICMGGYLGGVVFTTLIVWGINMVLLFPQGKSLEMISMQGLGVAFCMPLFISVFSLLPCLISQFKNMKTSV